MLLLADPLAAAGRRCASQEALTNARFFLNLQAMQRGTRGMQSGIPLAGAPARATRCRAPPPSHPSLCSGARALGTPCPRASQNTLGCQGSASTEQEVLGGGCSASASGGIACMSATPLARSSAAVSAPCGTYAPPYLHCFCAGGPACRCLSSGLILRLCRLSMGEWACLSRTCCPLAATLPPLGQPTASP